MKKHLLLLLGSLFVGLSASAENVTFLTTKQNRANWTISGCSQQPASADANTDGDLTRIIDDNINTYWHSCWSTTHNDFNHFFVIDRGEDANDPIYGFGYTPRQTATSGNGYVTECDVYVLDDITNLSTMSGANGGVQADAHSSLLTFIDGKTPAGHGSFNYTYGNADNRAESKVVFSAPANGRYILFVATRTNGDSNNDAEKGNPFANCADFCTYDGVVVPCNEVFRMKMRANEDSNSYVYWNGTNPETKHTADANAFVPERLWYLKNVGNGKVTLHTVATSDQFGMEFTTTTNQAAVLSSTPTELTPTVNVKTLHESNANAAATGFSLCISGEAYVNDAQSYLGVWNNSNAPTDGGSLVSFYALTDDDFSIFTNASDEEIEAAKANPSYTAISALFAALDPTREARMQLEGAIAAAEAYSIGTSVGQYNNAEKTFPTILANAKALATDENATVEALEAATATLDVTTLSLNIPTTGLYRFSGIQATPHYLASGEINHDGKTTPKIIEDADGNKIETVYYLDENNHLISFETGLALADYNSGSSDWKNRLVTASGVGTISFDAAPTQGKYIIHPASNRNLFNGRNIGSGVDAAGNNNTGNDYQWSITEVTWLPIPGSDGNFASICAPVSLKLKDKVTANKAEVVDGKVIYTPIAGDIIPANTAVVLHFTSGVERNPNNHLVYLEVNPSQGTALSEETGVQGSYLAVEKGADHKVFDGQKFSEPATDYTPGFHAYVEESGDALAAHYQVIDQILTPGKVYYIVNSDKQANRGLILHKAGESAIWSTGANKMGLSKEQAIQNAQNPENKDYHWTVISDNEGKYYLYNLGAEKFASAYKATTNSNAEFCWHFSDTPTAVEIKFHGWKPTANIAEAEFNIHGGQNNKTTRPAGIMLINNDAAPVVGVSGVSGDTDGCGWIFGEVAYETAPVVPTAAEIEAVKAEMIQGYEDAVVAASNGNYEGISVENGNHIGYYKNISQFVPAFAAIEEGSDAEAKHYAVARALNAMDNTEIYGFEHEKAYRFNAEDDMYYKAQLDAEARTVSVTTGYHADEEDNTVNWLAEVNEEDGTVTFSHSFEIPVVETEPAAAPMLRAAAEQEYETLTCFLAQNVTPRYNGFGQVSFAAADGSAIKTTVYAPQGDGREMTTGIKEVELSTANSTESTIYDLQGRRVNKPAHGLYIVNGKKVRL